MAAIKKSTGNSDWSEHFTLNHILNQQISVIAKGNKYFDMDTV